MYNNNNFSQSLIQQEMTNSRFDSFQMQSICSNSSSFNQYNNTTLFFSRVTSNNQFSIIDDEDGLSINIDQKILKKIKQDMITELQNEFKVNDADNLMKSIPNEYRKIYANSLMITGSKQVQDDLKSWLSQNMLSKVNDFGFIRYFYFKNSESYNKEDSQFGIKIVKYKNQITVLIGIIEQCLNQPLLYSQIFQKICNDFKQFQAKQIEEISRLSEENQQLQKESLKPYEEFINIIKMLFNNRLDKVSSLEINESLFKYLNSKDEPSSTLMKFLKHLIGYYCNSDYKAEDMTVFWKAFKIQVNSYFKDYSKLNVDQPTEDKQMDMAIIFEQVVGENYDFQNCYLLYKQSFLDNNQKCQEILPLTCFKCHNSQLNSIMYVKEISQKKARICWICNKNYK